jgi:hypothetical protein
MGESNFSVNLCIFRRLAWNPNSALYESLTADLADTIWRVLIEEDSSGGFQAGVMVRTGAVIRTVDEDPHHPFLQDFLREVQP